MPSINKPSVGLRKEGQVARTVNTQEYAQKRDAILDVAQRYIATKGYEQMTTQDLLESLQISKGAFYHYFESKQALLMALVERMAEQAEQLIVPIVSDRALPADDKLLRFFAVIDQYKRDNLGVVFAFLRIWYADENALFRHKLYLARIQRIVPWLAQIIEEGVAEGVFTTPYPDHAARVIIALLEDLGYAIAGLLLVEEGAPLDIPQMTQMGEATADTLERVLGMRSGACGSPGATISRAGRLFSRDATKGKEGRSQESASRSGGERAATKLENGFQLNERELVWRQSSRSTI